MRKDKVVSEMLGEETTLSPSDVCEMRFKRSLRGYDTTEVDRYLERVADVLEDLIGQVRSLKETVQEQKARIEEYRQMESTWRDALVSSQKFAEDTLAAARREANALLEEARLKRAQEAMEAYRLPEALTRDIQALEHQRARLRVEMLSILDTHRQLLDSHIPEQPSYLPSSDTNINYLTHNPEPEDGDLSTNGIDDDAETGTSGVWLGDGLPDVDDESVTPSDDASPDDSTEIAETREGGREGTSELFDSEEPVVVEEDSSIDAMAEQEEASEEAEISHPRTHKKAETT